MRGKALRSTYQKCHFVRKLDKETAVNPLGTRGQKFPGMWSNQTQISGSHRGRKRVTGFYFGGKENRSPKCQTKV